MRQELRIGGDSERERCPVFRASLPSVQHVLPHKNTLRAKGGESEGKRRADLFPSVFSDAAPDESLSVCPTIKLLLSFLDDDSFPGSRNQTASKPAITRSLSAITRQSIARRQLRQQLLSSPMYQSSQSDAGPSAGSAPRPNTRTVHYSLDKGSDAPLLQATEPAPQAPRVARQASINQGYVESIPTRLSVGRQESRSGIIDHPLRLHPLLAATDWNSFSGQSHLLLLLLFLWLTSTPSPNTGSF